MHPHSRVITLEYNDFRLFYTTAMDRHEPCWQEGRDGRKNPEDREEESDGREEPPARPVTWRSHESSL